MAAAEPNKDTLLGMFETMLRIKQCDERFRTLLSSGRITILGYYSPRGQEAISAGIAANLRQDDYMVTTYRGLHDHIAKGTPLRQLWAECIGKATGTCKGKGGSMHITDVASGTMVTTGIVGGGLPIATGLAWASQLKEDGRVTICNFGDGASNKGAFHESLNLAALWKLPVVFVCQNNQIAEHTLFSAGTSAQRIADRAIGYSMPGVSIDGNDVVEVWRTAREAIERARAGLGPTLIEAVTFRLQPHAFGAGGVDFPSEAVESAMLLDPFPRCRSLILERSYASEDDLAMMQSRIDVEIDDAADFAISSPEPDLEEVDRDVYVGVEG